MSPVESEKWIQQRMMGQETRNKLTDYWKDHEVKKEANGKELMNKPQKLELTWIGKDEQPRLET